MRDIDNIRSDFPLLQQKFTEAVVYFDNGATTQKPLCAEDTKAYTTITEMFTVVFMQ